MDFLKDMRAKLEELEEFAREAQEFEHQSQPTLFTPKKKGGRKAARQQGRTKQPRRQQGQKTVRQAAPEPRSSRRPVDSASCPVEEWREDKPQASQVESSGSSILHNLGAHMEEAFLIQEILGPPMCLRDED